ncbi:MAG: creatininase family protein [Pseudomonadota bacterium]
MHYGHLTRGDLGALAPTTVAIVPLGAMESHGPHLPLATDTVIAEAIVDRAADHLKDAQVPFVRLPSLWLGFSPEHGEEPGTLTLPAEAVLATLHAVGAGVSAQGIDRLILLNAHGGNIGLASVAAIQLRASHRLLVATPHWLDFGLPEAAAVLGDPARDVHGGGMETSIMLACAPHLVTQPLPGEAATSPPGAQLFPSGAVNWGWLASDLGRDGYVGAPQTATAEIGRAIIDHAGEALARLAKDLSNAQWDAP